MARSVNFNPSHTLGEFLLEPGLTRIGLDESSVDLRTPLARYHEGETPEFHLNIPLMSAIMQSVTGARLAIALAREGGIGFIFGSQPLRSQAAMVREVKECTSGFVRSKANADPDMSLEKVLHLMDETGYSTIPVTEKAQPSGELFGMVSRADIWRDVDPMDLPVKEKMTPFAKLDYMPKGTSLDDARAYMRQHRRKSLPIIDDDRKLVSLVFKKDYEENLVYPNRLVDLEKRLVVGAGINTRDYAERLPALLEAGVDVVCFDSSDGHNEYQARAITDARRIIDEFERDAKNGKRIVLGGGNIVTARGFLYLAEQGLDFIKVGMGGGSICITREQKGVGTGQATAVLNALKGQKYFLKQTGLIVPFVSDGGIVFDNQITGAIAMGSNAVMMGRNFAKYDEAEGPMVILNGGIYKGYWGEGSLRAQNWDRYSDSGSHQNFLIEGVEGYVPFGGKLSYGLAQTLKKIRSAFVNTGVRSIHELHTHAVLRLVSTQTMVEGGAHDIVMPFQIQPYSAKEWGLHRAA